MPSRYYTRNFIPGYFYHFYNRGVNKPDIFNDDEDYKTFQDILSYYLVYPEGIPISVISQRNSDRSINKVPNLI